MNLLHYYKILLDKAQTSHISRILLTRLIPFGIPFNSSHKISVYSISDDEIKLKLPYIRSNMNHLKGQHACALATVSELSSGLFLMAKVDPTAYRIIMKSLSMTYHYQGTSDCIATLTLGNKWISENVVQPLKSKPSVEVKTDVEVVDAANNHISTACVIWQIKSWSSVKTKRR